MDHATGNLPTYDGTDKTTEDMVETSLESQVASTAAVKPADSPAPGCDDQRSLEGRRNAKAPQNVTASPPRSFVRCLIYSILPTHWSCPSCQSNITVISLLSG